MTDSVLPARERLYPEVGAGGFSRVDGTVEFYQRVRSLATSQMVVLDFGAGRGQAADDPVPYRRALRKLRGHVAQVIGVDVDPVVLTNPLLDAAFTITEGEKIPVDDDSVDMILSDWAFEHIPSPMWAATEFHRVLKPGGWICARTPNRHGYIGIGARLVPNRLHNTALRRLQPEKAARDTFATLYMMNTLADLRRLFPPERYSHYTYPVSSEPAYFGSSFAAWRIASAALRLTPARVQPILHIFLRKRGLVSSPGAPADQRSATALE